LVLGLAIVTPVRMIVGLGGLVLMGSSVGSTKQLELSLKQKEDEGNAAIDALEFVDLGDGAADFAFERLALGIAARRQRPHSTLSGHSAPLGLCAIVHRA
jgi:hypothetical protein